MFMTGVLCTVCGAQVYFTKLHTLLKAGPLRLKQLTNTLKIRSCLKPVYSI